MLQNDLAEQIAFNEWLNERFDTTCMGIADTEYNNVVATLKDNTVPTPATATYTIA
jgi:hypothetical protein